MSTTQNLAYSIVQVAHNFGALATVGGSLAATKFASVETRRRLAKLVFAGWSIQGASGASFGAVSYYFYHQFPDISGVALAALFLKMACVASGFVLLATYLYRADRWPESSRRLAWLGSSLLAITALTAAAFLRWFS